MSRSRVAVGRGSGSALGLALLLGCVSFQPPSPGPATWRERAETRSEGPVRISAAVLGADETRRAFGSRLERRGIQPVWIEIENGDDQEYVVMLLGIDPDYFAPSEAAWISRPFWQRARERRMDFFLDEHAPVVVAPHTTVSGFVYTNYDPGGKAFAVELIGEHEIYSFDFVHAVPGFRADYMQVDIDSHYSDDEIVDLDRPGLRSYLESLPCCVLGGDGKTDGDPLNLVIVGDGLHMLATLVRRGWDLTETLGAGTALRTAFSSLFRSRYRTSPVSPLYLFGRPQDAAFQKARGTVDERNHLRLWLAPVRLEGVEVWVGQISRDIGVKLSSVTFITHKIDPVVDEARLYITLDVAASGYLAAIGHVAGVGESTREAPRRNYTLDPYYTDGLRAVLVLSDDPLGLDELDYLDWELAYR